MRIWPAVTLVLPALLVGTVASQDNVTSLHDLIGERGTVVDSLGTRGYTYHHTAKSDDSSVSYWQENRSGRCVSARVTNGTVVSVAYSDGDCVDQAGALEPQFFRTVCGVIRDGQTFRYRCQARDGVEDGRRFAVLRFPDNELKFYFHEDGKATIEAEGIAPRQARHSTSEGETDVITEQMTYFYISDRGMAASEVSNFKED